MKFPSAKKTAKLCTQKSIKYSAVFPYIGREVMIFEDKERNLISNAENVWKLRISMNMNFYNLSHFRCT